MDYYHIWCALKSGVRDTDFSDAAHGYFAHLQSENLIAGYRITRRKLGLGPAHLPEWHLVIETDGLAQLDAAFSRVSSRDDPVEGFHHAVNALVDEVFFALYRDFPDAGRQRGEERF
jgi:hypothetical protein